jgi:predicted nucleotidyltransferase
MAIQQSQPVLPVVPAVVSAAAAQVVSQTTALVPPDLLLRLVRSLTPDRVLLFGSRAHHLARPASDIDLLLEGPWSMESAQLLRHARHLVMHSFPRVDLVLCTPEETIAAQAGHAPFLRSILESGVVIYQR